MHRRSMAFAIKELLGGKERGFDLIYEKTNKLVYSVAFAYLKDYSLAKDIVQETYLQFLKNLNNFKLDQSLNNYLITIAKNLSLNILEKRKKEEHVDFVDNEWKYPELIEEPNYNFDTPIFDIAKKNLDNEDLQLLLLIAISGYKRREVASLLNTPLPTITWRYNQIIKKLREILTKEGYK